MRLEWGTRGRPRLDPDAAQALEAAREAGDEEMAAFFDPPVEPPRDSLAWVAAVSRPLTKLERKPSGGHTKTGGRKRNPSRGWRKGRRPWSYKRN